jgi:hypothetical protein
LILRHARRLVVVVVVVVLLLLLVLLLLTHIQRLLLNRTPLGCAATCHRL